MLDLKVTAIITTYLIISKQHGTEMWMFLWGIRWGGVWNKSQYILIIINRSDQLEIKFNKYHWGERTDCRVFNNGILKY